MNVREYLEGERAVEPMVIGIKEQDFTKERVFLLPHVDGAKERLIEDTALNAEIIDGQDKEEIMILLGKDGELFERLFKKAARQAHMEMQDDDEEAEEYYA